MHHFKPRQAHADSGVSLIECLAAIAIIGSSLAAGFSLFGIHGQTCALNESTWYAQRYLSRELERVQATEFEGLATSAFAPVEEDARYSTRRVVADLAADARQVTVEVQWTTPTGKQLVKSATTIRCQEVE